MEKMDSHLYDIINKQKWVITKVQQLEIIDILRKLDEISVFHGYMNLLNYMYKDNKLYVIDFGMAKKINSKLRNQLGSENPNIEISLLSIVLLLRDNKFPEESYKYLKRYINKLTASKFGF